MRNRLTTIAIGCALAVAPLTGAAIAQTSASGGVVVAEPTYTSIPLETEVNRPATQVWERVGGHCDISDWFQIPCTITSGEDGEIGAVRSVRQRGARGQDRAVLHLHAARQR